MSVRQGKDVDGGLTASERIRTDWHAQNFASLRHAAAKPSETTSDTDTSPAEMQISGETKSAAAEHTADRLDQRSIHSEQSSEAVAENRTEHVHRATVNSEHGNTGISGTDMLPGFPYATDRDEKHKALSVLPVSTESVSVDSDEPAVEEALVSRSDAFPVDLPTVLRLAGGHNWAVQLAWERINQAEANVDAADVLWVPSLNLGIGATRHEGRIQAINGQIVDVSRNSLFVGGGAKVANAPMAGGAGGPARLFVDLPIADVLFQPLVARQLSRAARHRHTVEFNNAQLDAAIAYFDLVAAQGEVAATDLNLHEAENLLSITEAFVTAGRASAAEVSRVKVIVANRQQSQVNAKLKLKIASSELIRIVRLDPALLSADALLYSADDHLLAIDLISESCDLESLIAQGQRCRPEVAEHYALAQAEGAGAKSQKLRPFIPHVNLGMSAGGFDGGPGSNRSGLGVRSDFDAILVWQVRNFGFGERAARRESDSRYRQSVLRAHQVQDQIAADVRNAWHRVDAGRQRTDLARRNVEDASRVLQMNLDRIRGLEGLPLEAIQALNGVSSTRLNLLRAIVDYNKAQTSLLRAIGRPVSQSL